MEQRVILPGEAWLPIPGFPFYEVSSLGRIWSTPRERTPGGLRTQQIRRDGYWMLRLPQLVPETGKTREVARQVHQLVALAFLGPRPAGMEVRHLDGDPSNCVLANLVYGTHWENAQDILRHGHNRQLLKTHCPQGHEYTPENIYSNPNLGRPNRICRQCTHRPALVLA